MKFLPKHSSAVQYNHQTQKLELHRFGQKAVASFLVGMPMIGFPLAYLTAPYIGVASLLFVFMGGLGAWFSYVRVMYNRLHRMNNESALPHEEIPDFLDWEEGDKVYTDHFSRLNYEGVANDRRLIFSKGGFETDYFAFSPLYVGKYLDENDDLKERKKKEQNRRLKSEAKNEKEYEKYIEMYKDLSNSNNIEDINEELRKIK